ncbi:hypothetical protein HDA40_007868 [Hamadaea flava]|uniref:Uncharacterized protein n=1 Tax=Hamadaea flava TaxID=1742688 RepID=A0ABV8LZI3_9ACTN|nr:hypothetical protein [Hamadaea flava]MCP2329361.1 hypothetical protein [Hamadaea flava]
MATEEAVPKETAAEEAGPKKATRGLLRKSQDHRLGYLLGVVYHDEEVRENSPPDDQTVRDREGPRSTRLAGREE